MRRRQVELAFIDLERKLATDARALDLHEGHGLRFPGGADERDRHFIRGVDRFDQHLFVAFQAGGIIDQKGGEFIEAGVLHRTVSFHREEGMQTGPVLGPLLVIECDRARFDARAVVATSLGRKFQACGKGAVELITEGQALFPIRQPKVGKAPQELRDHSVVLLRLQAAGTVD